MGKLPLGVILALVSFNFLFVSDSSNHTMFGLLFLAALVILFLSEIQSKLKL
ncbi:hypothetical protein HY380_01440 [Candidatus Saccharibacteria bacterium]|nr:hypothetical protein [Candidatus Saccharibacteria bacterium]